MLHKFKKWLGLIAALTVVFGARAFTLSGPAEAWQTTALSYGDRFWYGLVSYSNSLPLNLGNTTVTEVTYPKNYGEGSRLNTPTITYAFDSAFLSYFGEPGKQAVESAFAVLNALPAVSSASRNLTEFNTEGNQQINYTAQALSMVDIKSAVLQVMMEHMGLLGETHVFDLLNQVPFPGGPTCYSEYFVGIRNWDPITYAPSTYVNGFNYTFHIVDGCAAGTAIADAIEVPADTAVGSTSTAVATFEDLQLGGYYQGLTRDDFGGLRYLYSKTNFNYEALPPNCYVGLNTGTYSPVVSNSLATGWIGTVAGVEKFNFVEVAYNSPVGTNYNTNTVHYNLTIFTNGGTQQLSVWRTNTAPDIIFTASNLVVAASPSDPLFTRTAPTYLTAAATTSGGGYLAPVFSPALTVTLNNAGPLYLSENPGFIDDLTPTFLYPYFQWGSFDGSTNAPIAFPQGISLAELEAYAASGGALTVGTTWSPLASTNTTATGSTAGAVAGGGAAASLK